MSTINSFDFASSPQLHFGSGKISLLPALIKSYGTEALLITGARSFTSSSYGARLLNELEKNGINIEHYTIDQEPTPKMIDVAVKKFSYDAPDVVVSIGGGSVLDAGKAIAAMLPLNGLVKNFLEGVGSKVHPGIKVPFVAIPTTAGTGSEATKNAVLSETGENGYKRSLRHNNFVPNVAIVDPDLTISCPPAITAASGMDAFTQLLESYLSTKANPITEALALEGLKLIARSLYKAYHDGADINARSDMALASYLSGVTLANAGLGLVHGFASSVGGYFDIPHGVICSSLMAPANKLTVKKLRLAKNSDCALKKYSTVGKIFSAENGKSDDYYIDYLIKLIAQWAGDMNIPKLSVAGVASVDFSRIADVTENKNNPVALGKEEMIEVLEMAG